MQSVYNHYQYQLETKVYYEIRCLLQQFYEVTLISFSYNQRSCLDFKVAACQLTFDKNYKSEILLFLEKIKN